MKEVKGVKGSEGERRGVKGSEGEQRGTKGAKGSKGSKSISILGFWGPHHLWQEKLR